MLGVVIFGMSRSGTSAVTAMFVRAGFYAGASDELMPADCSNPGGYWENLRILRANEEILARLGGTWLRPPGTEAQRAASDWAGLRLRAELDRLVEGAAGAPIVIKDPRIGVLLPLWQPLIDGLLAPIIVTRDPIEIADSLRRRDGTPRRLALAAWELHMSSLLACYEGRPVTVAPFAAMLESPERAAVIVRCAVARLSPALTTRVAPDRAPAALERKYRNHTASDEDRHRHLTVSQARLWRFLSSLPAGEGALRFPPRLGATEREAMATLVAIQRSVSWRITRPLRAGKRIARSLGRRYSQALGQTRACSPRTIARPPRGRAPREISPRPIVCSPRGRAPCEIHVPISPTPSFITRVRYLAASVRAFGGCLAEAPVIVTVGGDEPFDIGRAHPWSGQLGVVWRWVEEPLWRRYGAAATALQRFRYEIDAPGALMLDADTLFVAPVDDAIADVIARDAIAGLPAHVSPFAARKQALWQEIFGEAGLPMPAMVCEHSGWHSMEFNRARRYCPPYFNMGVLLASSPALKMVASSVFFELDAVERVERTFFRCQLAVTLAILRSGVRWRELPLRFNFPNDTRFLPRNRAELEDARIIHYLREDEFTRDDGFASVESVGELLSRKRMNPINERLRAGLEPIHQQLLAA